MPDRVAGYSGKPLESKLGIAPGHRVALIGAPAEFALSGVATRRRLAADLDVIVCFVTQRSALERRLTALRNSLAPGGGLWLAWPKRASRVPSDVSENLLRELLLPTGLVDNKVCAIDETWSALRFVWRRELR